MGLLTAVQIYIDDIKGKAIGGTFDVLRSMKVPSGHVLEVRHTAVENQTTAYTRLLLGMDRGSDFHQKEAQEAPAVDILYWTRSRMFVPPGHTLTARLYGCTAGDDILMSIEGVLYKRND